MWKQKSLGLTLSGGGARAFAHVGVLKALAEAGLTPQYICGTSMGGILAAAVAAGLPVEELEAHAYRLSEMHELVRLVSITDPSRGLIDASRVHAYLHSIFGDELTFEDLSIPLALVAVDLHSGVEVQLDSGPLLPALFATISIPGFFEPIAYRGMELVDGGVLNNLPVANTRKLGAEVVVAIEVQNNPRNEPPLNELAVRPGWQRLLPDAVIDFYRAELIMVAELTRLRLEKCPPDVLIEPLIPPHITMFDGFFTPKEIIAAGEMAGQEALPAIQAALGNLLLA